MARVAGSSSYYELGIIDPTGHVKGRTAKIPSVTSILKALPKDGLTWWAYKLGAVESKRLLTTGKIPTEADDEFMYEEMKRLAREGEADTPNTQRDKGGERGTDIHDIAEALFKEGKMPPKADIPENRIGYAQALWNWYLEHAKGKKVILVEEPLFSQVHNYAGTVDLILLDEETGIYYVIDFKTSKGIYEGALMQIVAYREAAKERGFIPLDANVVCTVVSLSRPDGRADGTYQMKTSDCDFNVFLSIKAVWEWLEEMKGAKTA